MPAKQTIPETDFSLLRRFAETGADVLVGVELAVEQGDVERDDGVSFLHPAHAFRCPDASSPMTPDASGLLHRRPDPSVSTAVPAAI